MERLRIIPAQVTRPTGLEAAGEDHAAGDGVRMRRNRGAQDGRCEDDTAKVKAQEDWKPRNK
jgi:hypothetical protein